MRFIVLAAVVLVVLGSLMLLRAIYRRYLNQQKWTINERSSAQGRYYVELTHPSNNPLIVAGLNPDGDEFEYDLEEARSRAVTKAISMNARRKLFK